MADAHKDGFHAFVLFRLSGDLFAFSVDEVGEVVPIAWLARPPGTPAAVEGVLDLAGTALPVLRLARLLGLDSEPAGLDASILVMAGGPAPTGLLVDHVEGVRGEHALTVLPVSDADSFNGCVAAELSLGGGLSAHLLSWSRLLLADEQVRLGEFQAKAQSRLADWTDATL